MELEALAFFLLSLPAVEAAALLLIGASGSGRFTQVSGVLDALVTAEASQIGRGAAMRVEFELTRTASCQPEELRGWLRGQWLPDLATLLRLSELLLASVEVRPPTSLPLSPAEILAGPREGRARVPSEALRFQASNQVDVGLWIASLPEPSQISLEAVQHDLRAQPAPLQRVLILTGMGVELAGKGRVALADVLGTMRGEPTDSAEIAAYLRTR